MAYSRYAQSARAEYLKENKETPPLNYIGPARTYHAAKAGRSRTAGYSVARQGGRDAARQRAEERKTQAFDRLSAARATAFTGLNEKTPALDAHFGANRPESSSRGGAAKDTGPRGTMGAHPDTGPRGTMGAWGQKKPQRPAAPTPPAAPGPLPGFPAPAENPGQTVGGMALDAFRKNRTAAPAPPKKPEPPKPAPVPTPPPAKPIISEQPKPAPPPPPPPKQEPPRQVVQPKPAAPAPPKPKPSGNQTSSWDPTKSGLNQFSGPGDKPLKWWERAMFHIPDAAVQVNRQVRTLLGQPDPGDKRPSFLFGSNVPERTPWGFKKK